MNRRSPVEPGPDSPQEDPVQRGPIIFVTEQAPHDYSPALPFGEEIRAIRAPALTPNAPEEAWNFGSIHDIRRALADYMPGFDLVIPTGHPVRMMLVGMLLAQRGDRHQILGWDARAQRYLKYVLNIKDIR